MLDPDKRCTLISILVHTVTTVITIIGFVQTSRFSDGQLYVWPATYRKAFRFIHARARWKNKKYWLSKRVSSINRIKTPSHWATLQHFLPSPFKHFLLLAVNPFCRWSLRTFRLRRRVLSTLKKKGVTGPHIFEYVIIWLTFRYRNALSDLLNKYVTYRWSQWDDIGESDYFSSRIIISVSKFTIYVCHYGIFIVLANYDTIRRKISTSSKIYVCSTASMWSARILYYNVSLFHVRSAIINFALTSVGLS